MFQRVTWALPLALCLSLFTGFSSSYGSSSTATPVVEDPAEFRAEMRKLWEDHVSWTRLYIVSFSAGLPDLKVTQDRLLQNQKNIGDAIRPYYGDAAGDQLTQLLTEHIQIGGDLLVSAKSGDKSGVESNTLRWTQNSDAISQFLFDANPTYLKLDDLKMMMHKHLALTTTEAVTYLQGDWQASVKAYDEVRAEILEMSDMIANGLIQQFPVQP